jgi:hypothetical protein
MDGWKRYQCKLCGAIYSDRRAQHAWHGDRGQLLLAGHHAGGVRGPLPAGCGHHREHLWGEVSMKVHVFEMLKGMIFCGLLPVSGFQGCK